jgi:catechol 2,3-dioxygenase-like lactoylglutathione lyase family enzyme
MLRIDHVNVRCTDLAVTKAFFESAVGLKEGWRPPFPFPGHWLYDETGRAVVHLIAARQPLGEAGAVDHVAFRFDDLHARLRHLESLGHVVQMRTVPGTDLHQGFLFGPDGIQIEFQGEVAAAG